METVFWQRFTALCREYGISPNGAMVASGLNTGNPTAWKNGRIPGASTLQVLAGYFECPIEYLLGKSDSRYWPYDPRNKQLDEMAEEEKAPSGAEIDALTEDELLAFALFGSDYKSISVEKLAEIRRYAEFIKDK